VIVIPNPIKIANGTRYDGPAITHTVTLIETRPVQPKSNLTDLYRELWAELHGKQDISPEWFQSWRLRVPSDGCQCRIKLDEYVADHPVDYSDFATWAIDFHNFVNVRLGKPVWPSFSE
jgi:hypothetical protein